MTGEGFDALAVRDRSAPLPEQTQDRHIALLRSLLAGAPADLSAGASADRPAAEIAEIAEIAETTETTEIPGEPRGDGAGFGTTDAGAGERLISALPPADLPPADLPSADLPSADIPAADTQTPDRPNGTSRTSGRWTKRSVLIAAAAATVLAGAGVGTAAALGAFSAPTDRNVAHCYVAADLDAARTSFAVAVDSEHPRADAAGYALDICGSNWADGRLRPGMSTISQTEGSRQSYPIPPLAVCVLESGQVGVFPGDQKTCAALGLPVADL